MTWAAAFALVRRFWWVVPMAGLCIALWITRGKLDDRTATLKAERAAWTAEIAKSEQLLADAEKRFAVQQSTALTAFADRLANREPIILRSTDTVRTYAQTDAGRAACLPVDRVRGIDALDAELVAGHPTRSGGGEQALSAYTGPPPIWTDQLIVRKPKVLSVMRVPIWRFVTLDGKWQSTRGLGDSGNSSFESSHSMWPATRCA